MKPQIAASLVVFLVSAGLSTAFSAPAVVLENVRFRYTISSAAQNLEFSDRATGRNYLRGGAASSCARIRRGGNELEATEASRVGDQLTLRFGDAGVEVRIQVESRPACVVLAVESIRGEVDALSFLDVPLALEGRPQEAFGACALSLNLFTRVDALPALQRELRASSERKFGLVGAKAAIVAAPMEQMLSALQETLATVSELPLCKVAGPWAHEIPFNHGSYLFNFGSLTETNVEDWIETTRRLGFTQIDNHGGGAFFRFGDFELNREKWPDGWDSFRRIVARLHEAGVGSIFHTYSFFIDKRSKYVTPVPDPRLDAFRAFTLAEPVAADATEITVNESTAGLSTVTGFFEHNSVLLHVGDELVTFGGVSKEPPWRFTGVARGAHGTKAAAHERGATARHLKECFGLLVPNPESSLFEEIAARHAAVVNECGFDGIYLDAIDGSSILRGGDECWYWADKFVVEIQKRLRRPVGMEMSAMWHHFWQYRTRWQAWDVPRRGQQRFVDLHAAAVNGSLLLPLHLGWWELWAFNPPQIEPSYPEVMEHLGARLIGWDAGISLTAGVDRDALLRTPLFARAADILSTCEELRHANAFDAAAKARLRDPTEQFALFTNADGKKRFRSLRACPQTMAMDEPWARTWTVTNAYAAQPVRFRIEALMSAAPAPDSNAVLVADLGREAAGLWKRTAAEGVSLEVPPASAGEDRSGVIRAASAGKVPRHAAWARLEKRFAPPLDAKDGKALAVEVEGDGSGAVLAIRLESPQHLAYGAIADRYVPLDFTGRRKLTLVETESSRWSDYVWNDGKHPYHVYRETVNFGAIESVSVWLQNLGTNQETSIRLGPVRAIPFRSVPVRRPRLIVNGQSLELPVELAPGSWVEGNGPEHCLTYGPRGEPLGKATPVGLWPELRAGVNSLQFAGDPGAEAQPRVRVTVFSFGGEL